MYLWTKIFTCRGDDIPFQKLAFTCRGDDFLFQKLAFSVWENSEFCFKGPSKLWKFSLAIDTVLEH